MYLIDVAINFNEKSIKCMTETMQPSHPSIYIAGFLTI